MSSICVMYGFPSEPVEVRRLRVLRRDLGTGESGATLVEVPAFGPVAWDVANRGISSHTLSSPYSVSTRASLGVLRSGRWRGVKDKQRLLWSNGSDVIRVYQGKSRIGLMMRQSLSYPLAGDNKRQRSCLSYWRGMGTRATGVRNLESKKSPHLS